MIECDICGETITRSSNRQKRCPGECHKEHERRRLAAHRAMLQSAQEIRTCPDCDATFTVKASSTVIRCADHQRPMRDANCGNCHAPMRVPGVGRVRRLCLMCRPAWQSARVGAWVKAYKAKNGIAPNWVSRDKTRAVQRGAVAVGPPVDRFEVFETAGWVCGICNEPVDPSIRHPSPASASLDHIIPISQGGHHSRENVRLAHLGCNVAEGNRLRTAPAITASAVELCA